MLSLSLGSIGLFINVTLSKNFAPLVVVARNDVARLDQAATKAAAAESTEAAAEARAIANPPRGLTNQEANAVIKKAESVCGALTEAERRTLTSALLINGQRIVDPSVPVQACYPGPAGRIWFDQPRQQLVTAQKMRNPLVMFQVIHRQSAQDHPTIARLDVSPDGELINLDIDSPAGREFGGLQNPARELSYWGLSPVNPFDGYRAHGKLEAAWMGLIAATIAALLSILLLLGGVLLLVPKAIDLGLRLHWIYAFVKILIALFSAFAFAQAASEPDPSSPFSEGMAQTIAATFALIGCIYPIVLIFILRGSMTAVDAEPRSN